MNNFIKKNMKNIALMVLALIVITFMAYTIFNSYPRQTGQLNLDEFAKCLNETGVKMYGTEWCSHCKEQKKLFGESFQFANYIDCDENKEICMTEGIQGYPTWKYEGKEYLGVQTLEFLSDLSGCEL
ncbi:MAG: hypothetical protein QT05_C0049G0041 [archaeon GW2011_AR13]|nr:MAG: hypothetical protein QT05_C0049G0041 [archaeon GW2011_AR13]HIG94531.1 hypothetical protein [Nanoarchaeota archaeon]HIH63032.1 hypothetical protein [Nanoarchaeota archaeon]HIJ09541.1 hypothetical protein [Nanoarchaeota archaeon]